MAAASSPLSSSLSTTSSLSHLISNPHRPSHPLASSISVRSPLPSRSPSLTSLRLRLRLPPLPSLSNGSGDNGGESNGSGDNGGESNVSGDNFGGGESNISGDNGGESNGSGDDGGKSNGNGDNFGGGGGDGGDGGDDDESEGKEDRNEALLVLANLGRSLDSLPMDLAEAVREGRVNGEIVMRFIDLENSPLLKWLMHFGGFRERLLADDIFLAKILMECGVGLFTKAAAEYQKRKETFFKELDIVISDMVMAFIADFMLVWLSASTVSLGSSAAIGSGPIDKLFRGCPDNAFQVALAGKSYSLLQRIGALVRNGSELFVVGSVAQLIGSGVTNAFIKARKAVDKENAHGGHEGEHVEFHLLGYGAYMAVSSNLRYQFLAGVIEQRMLVPLLHNHKSLLKALCFAIRTGNTFLGSLLWVDYARWIGIQ